ncbi:MAG: hypothetical protein J5588_06340 [Bacteroidales bacterium]|nr:hypothetical protein [Bacteroidales bacterium]MBP5372433.1 hypothetical protein [Bacteroidales bacterium]
MKIVYSYHGGKPSDFLLKMARLSLLSVKHYTDYPTELWVDKENLAFFGNGYDSYVVSDFGNPDARYWNMSKLYVYAQQTEPFLHIDFDTCVMPGFTIPDDAFVCEKMRKILIDDEYTKHALNAPVYDEILCSGFLGGSDYGYMFKEHYDWAKRQANDTPTYKNLISLEEVALTQRIRMERKNIGTLPTDTFLHFWCRRNLGVSKEDIYGIVVSDLLKFMTNK